MLIFPFTQFDVPSGESWNVLKYITRKKWLETSVAVMWLPPMFHVVQSDVNACVKLNVA
jgi:hypothetical protein